MIEIAENAVRRGVLQAEQWLGEAVQEIPAVRNLTALSTQLHANEVSLEEMRLHLTRMRASGIAKPSDYQTYAVARENMYRTHRRYHRLLSRVFATFPDTLGQLPPPRYAPKISATAPTPASVSGLLGLGNPAAGAAGAAAAAAGLGPWMMAGIVLIILVALVAVIAIVISGELLGEVVRDTVLGTKTLAITHEMWERRERHVADCTSAGNPSAACSQEAAALYPPPPNVLRNIPADTSWIPWVVGGAVTLGVLGFTVWAVNKYMGGGRTPALAGASAPRFRSMSPDEFLDSDGGDYHMQDVD